MMTLRVVRTSPTSPSSPAHEVSVPDRAAAHAHLAYYRDDADTITAYLTGPDGSWHGSGIAGGGTVRSDWAS